MRIIAGEAKGRRLRSPVRCSVKPTTGLVRGAIFSILEASGVKWHRMLDLYAGTGALGIEALSRGAEQVDFVDRDPRCRLIIRDNLERSEFKHKAQVYCCSASRITRVLKGEYDVVLIDPPYNDPSLIHILGMLFSSNLVGPNSTVVVQHSSHQLLPATVECFQVVKNYRYGDTALSIYQQEEN